VHGQLSTPDGYVLMASDPPPGAGITVGDDITLALFGDDAETLRGHFAAFAEGGTVTTPLEAQVWGDEHGSLKDKYGVNRLADVAGAPA
jgi:PhnB protein